MGGAVATKHLVDRHQRDGRLLEAESAMALGKHDLVEAEFAQTADPAKRVDVLLVALGEVRLPVLALHVLAVAINDKLLLVSQFEVHFSSLDIQVWHQRYPKRCYP